MRSGRPSLVQFLSFLRLLCKYFTQQWWFAFYQHYIYLCWQGQDTHFYHPLSAYLCMCIHSFLFRVCACLCVATVCLLLPLPLPTYKKIQLWNYIAFSGKLSKKGGWRWVGKLLYPPPIRSSVVTLLLLVLLLIIIPLPLRQEGGGRWVVFFCFHHPSPSNFLCVSPAPQVPPFNDKHIYSLLPPPCSRPIPLPNGQILFSICERRLS